MIYHNDQLVWLNYLKPHRSVVMETSTSIGLVCERDVLLYSSRVNKIGIFLHREWNSGCDKSAGFLITLFFNTTYAFFTIILAMFTHLRQVCITPYLSVAKIDLKNSNL